MLRRLGGAVLLLVLLIAAIDRLPEREAGETHRSAHVAAGNGAVGQGQADQTRDRGRERDHDQTRGSRPASVPPGARLARVSDHVDGDTLRLMAERTSAALRGGETTTVRLLEIDTPESVAPGSPIECFAHRSNEALARMLPLGARVWFAADRDLLDPYDRTLLYLWTRDGRFVNLAMVRRGYARAVLYEPNDAYIGLMRRAEEVAQKAERGLWGACRFFGQPLGLAGVGSAPPVAGPTAGQDPRFATCGEANDAGLGNYVTGRDREYDWYVDGDRDGTACEF